MRALAMAITLFAVVVGSSEAFAHGQGRALLRYPVVRTWMPAPVYTTPGPVWAAPVAAIRPQCQRVWIPGQWVRTRAGLTWRAGYWQAMGGGYAYVR